MDCSTHPSDSQSDLSTDLTYAHPTHAHHTLQRIHSRFRQRIYQDYLSGFPPDVLAIYTIVTFVLAVVTYGIAVPSGLFVPCILIGSGYGRCIGELLRMGLGEQIQPGTYALIGAASMLSGVCRITITLTVILYETTDNLDLILPIMATVIVAKWVADMFNISLCVQCIGQCIKRYAMCSIV